MQTYKTSFIHKISNRNGPTPGQNVQLRDGAFADRKTLGKALREAGTLPAGTVVSEFRVEGDRVVVFPRGLVWHSVTLEAE